MVICFAVIVQFNSNICRFQFQSNSIDKVCRCHGLVKFIRSSWFGQVNNPLFIMISLFLYYSFLLIYMLLPFFFFYEFFLCFVVLYSLIFLFISVSFTSFTSIIIFHISFSEIHFSFLSFFTFHSVFFSPPLRLWGKRLRYKIGRPSGQDECVKLERHNNE